MSSAAYIATSKVRHIAVWTATNARPDDISHDWRPLCGRRGPDVTWPSLWSPNVSPADLDPQWRKRFEAAMRRPVCKDCTTVVDAASALLDRPRAVRRQGGAL